MSVDEKSVEQFAKSFHHYREALAHDFGCGRQQFLNGQQLPSTEQKLLVAAVRLALMNTRSEDQPIGWEKVLKAEIAVVERLRN